MTTKEQEITAIARLIGITDPGLSRGSTVPSALFDGVCRRFGLDDSGTMPERAARIVGAAGLPYSVASFDSTTSPSGGGSTVTLDGLQQIRAAVHRLIDREQ